MNPELPIHFSHMVTVADEAVGAEVAIFAGERAIPDHLGDEDGYFSLNRHQDGSHCPDECGCGKAEPVQVGIDQTVVIGEWTVHTSRTHIVSWRRTGPSDAETALEVRAATAEKALHDEEVVHRSTLGDLRRTREALACVISAHDETKRELRLADAAKLRAEEDVATWMRRAVGGVAAVGLVLVLLLVWVAIA
jgi:hypothetical protein